MLKCILIKLGSSCSNWFFRVFFDRKAILNLIKPAGMELEELELELIDAGLEEIEEGRRFSFSLC